MGLYKLQKLGDQLKDKQLATAHVKVFVEKAADGLADVVRRDAASRFKVPSLDVDVQNLDVQKGRADRHRRLRDSVRGGRVLVEAADAGSSPV